MFFRPSRKLVICTATLLIGFAASLDARAQDHAVDKKFYAEKIYPLLKGNCFKCHGEGEKLKSGFRITNRDDLIRGGDLGSALNPSDPARSRVLKMIDYADDDHQMPPKNKLPDEQIKILRHWILNGAHYDPKLEIAGNPDERKKKAHITDADRKYWAYQKVSSPATSQNLPAGKNPIDALLEKRLKQTGLKANGSASRQTLIRRAYYDLTGLPPTPKEVATFVNDPRSDDLAWAQLIDHLLKLPQYGEKWARHWLDLVRYAETNGFERDNAKPHIWRYRDYVINSFNQDKAYDQFIIEQLAGDEIAQPTQASITATGFHRLMQWDDEPADRQQHVFDVLADDVQVTAETFLGTTMGCARCHDHKADPITQKDYYSFMAFFTGIIHYKTEGTLVHFASAREKSAFEKNRQSQIKTLSSQKDNIESQLRVFLRSIGKSKKRNQTQTFIDDARGQGKIWTYTTQHPSPDWFAIGFRNKSWSKGKSGFGQSNTPGAKVNTTWKNKNIWLRTSFGLKHLPKTLVLDIHHDEDVEVYLNGGLIFKEKGFLKKYQTFALPAKALELLQTGKNVIAVHCRQTTGGQYFDLALRTGSDQTPLLHQLITPKDQALIKKITAHFKRDLWQEFKQAEKKLAELKRLSAGIAINAVTENGKKPEPLFIHIRGSAHAPGEAVVPAFPTVLGQLSGPQPATITAPTDQHSSGRRLALAQWLTSPDHPLTGRVIANRLWQHHFGRGIVRSTNDFGKLGVPPTHPEILDYLSQELQRQNGSLKSLHRIIMRSDAYRRSSAGNSHNLGIDPQNNLFWRFDMRRLTAEELRDSILAMSGDLNLKAGGPWVLPPLPQAVLNTASRPDKAWPLSPDPRDYYRRSVYIHVKRSLRHPMLAEFDQADTDTPCAVRFATTVPNQALSMLNSHFINQQAEKFAAYILQQAGTDKNQQIRYALGKTLQRPPQDHELQQCQQFMAKMTAMGSLNEQQVLQRLALLALNLNEFIYLD
ncbi:MAG: PSD1 and planctomycete cytochrome C domain-containing protein [Verrucomicrobiota bacterium]